MVGALRRADAVLQRLVPVGDARVSWMSDPDGTGNAYHLFRHALTTRPGLEHVWLVRDDAAAQRIEAEVERWRAAGAVAAGSSVRAVRRRSVRGYWRWLRSRRSFHTHGAYPMTHRGCGRDVVSLWHGMPIKAIGALNTATPNPNPTFGTHHLATSPMFQDVIARAFRVPSSQVLLTGLPRCDVLLRPHPLGPDRAAALGAFGVEAGRVVLWTPTYRAMGAEVADPTRPPSFLDDLRPGCLEEIDAAAGATSCTVLVKLHPFDPLNEIEFHLGLGNIRLVRSAEMLRSGFELYDLLAHCDGLLTDVSSILIDFLVTDRPAGIVGFVPETYHRDVVVPVERLLDSPRIDDLADGPAVERFFAAVAGGASADRVDGDLVRWLHGDTAGDGCEAVLVAVGL